MADYRVLDIETVPDREVWTPPPRRWRQEPVDLGRREDLSQNAPTLWYPEDQFPPPQACRIVAISWCDLVSDDSRYYHFDGVDAYSGWSSAGGEAAEAAERYLLKAFCRAEEDDVAQLVTWNGRTFDLPVINLRALKHKISMKWYYTEDGMRYRYGDGGHCDLMDYLGDYGAGRNMKLHDVCRLVGLPGKTGDLSGSSVAEEVASGDEKEKMDRVARYCTRDTVQTALVFVRSRFHKGMIGAAEHDAAVKSFMSDDDVQDVLPDVDWKRLMVSEGASK